jgi:hypothetical protein
MNRERDNHSFIRKEFGSEARERRGRILKENLVSQGRRILLIVELCCFCDLKLCLRKLAKCLRLLLVGGRRLSGNPERLA